MMSRLLYSTVIFMSLLGPGCAHTKAPMTLSALKPEVPKDPRWLDLGTLDVDDEVNVAMTSDYIYAQAGKSIFRKASNDNGRGPWTLLKAFDEDLSAIYAVSGRPDTIMASIDEAFENLPLRISHDGGLSWSNYGSEFTENPEAVGSEYESPKQFAKDASGALYASLSGTNTAVSKDLGRTWSYVFGKAGLQPCYNGITAVLPAFPLLLFKGQECPLDEAFIGSFDLSKTEGSRVMDKLVSPAFLGNQRPHSFASTPLLPDDLFVGVDGGFLKYNVRTRSTEWLITAATPESGVSAGTLEPKDTHWDGSFTNIWIDPSNAQHIAISGISKGGTLDFLIFETTDGGKTFQSIRPPTDPNALSKTNGGASLDKKLVIPAREGDRKVRIWLVDLSVKSR